ncbi:acylphosphatase [Marinobacter sp.]|uniref:acylphosphatase n=1 Tax=Marinobacter sp. TaxID=50741 RepID=UPI002B46F51D|nr:acylphosphatase [Marinobacter sp.]HKK56320.1 acylphosphatase [Marinobacter sp.]
MNRQRLTMLISGKVQGVSYRASAADKATSLGLTGYARNLHDGRVEVVAEGEPGALGAFQTWCNEGPPAADVDSISSKEDPATGEFTGFGVR